MVQVLAAVHPDRHVTNPSLPFCQLRLHLSAPLQQPQTTLVPYDGSSDLNDRGLVILISKSHALRRRKLALVLNYIRALFGAPLL
jgi:hypothetical protein